LRAALAAVEAQRGKISRGKIVRGKISADGGEKISNGGENASEGDDAVAAVEESMICDLSLSQRAAPALARPTLRDALFDPPLTASLLPLLSSSASSSASITGLVQQTSETRAGASATASTLARRLAAEAEVAAVPKVRYAARPYAGLKGRLEACWQIFCGRHLVIRFFSFFSRFFLFSIFTLLDSLFR
jgi:hypothetical protein